MSSTLYVAFAFTDADLLRDIPLMIFTLVVLLIFAFLPMVLLYLWARWLDRDRTPKPIPNLLRPVRGRSPADTGRGNRCLVHPPNPAQPR